MDRVIDLAAILQREITYYHGPAYKATTYSIQDKEQQIYTVVLVPEADYPTREKAGVVLARIVDDKICIEVDNTDHPLYERLLEAGISVAQLECKYL